MIDSSKVNINDVPKNFCEGGLCGHNKEAFMFLLYSGQQIIGFATTPTQMKSIVEMFDTQIAEYEKKFGKIEIPKPGTEQLIISPFQPGRGDTDNPGI